MKQFKFVTVSVIFAFLFAGCADDDLIKESVVLPVSGDEIEFGAASGGFTDVNPETKTIYDVPSGSSFDNYSLLNINWVYGTDQVRVYCPEGAEGFKTADYTVRENSGSSSNGYLEKNGENGVHWGDTSKEHNFYAFYSLGKIDDGLQNGTTVTATIPTGQEGGQLLTYNNQGEEDENGTFKIITPDMSFCMMAGKGTWTPGTNKEVSLTFSPIVTVLDVLVNGPSADQAGGITSMKIVSVSVRSKSGKNIVGTFSYDVASETYDFSATDGSQTATSIATVQTLDNTTNNPVEIKNGEQLNVKFFLLPREISDGDLIVSVFTEGGVVYSKTVTGTGITGDGSAGDGVLEPGLITRIKTPKLGGQNTNNWMSLVADNVLFTQLSLPGTKHSFAYDVDPDYDPNTGLSQFYQALPPLTPENGGTTQFDEGVRVFDVHLNLTGNAPTATPIVYAGGKDLSPQTTLHDVLNVLKSKVKPEGETATECAVVFLNFVHSATGDVETWLSAVMNSLDSWNSSNYGILTKLEANTTMGDVRGKIAVIINIREETLTPSGSAPVNYITKFSTSVQNINIITAPYSSGTNVRIQNLQQCNNPELTSGGSYGYRDGIGLVPYYITKANYLDNTVSCDLLETKKNLIHQLNQEIASGGTNLFINDLSGFCVTQNESSVGHESFGVYTYSNSNWGWSGSWSYNSQKFYDYKNVGDAPTSAPNNPTNGDIYIPNNNKENPTASSADLGNGGNTCLFAEKINPVAVNEYSSLVGDLRQPLGIVLMNFAGVATVNGSNSRQYQVQGIRLPGLIMMNNFMFPLKTGGTSQASSSNISYSKGMNVWD